MVDDSCLFILLPSDKEWRLKNYYKLVERQRELSASPMPSIWPVKLLKVETSWEAVSPGGGASQPPAAKRARVLATPGGSKEGSLKETNSLTSTLSSETTWTVADIAKAGCLLQNPPLEAGFEDEEEMRRVYALIYDVFRYKPILNQTLCDATFYVEHPKFTNQQNVVELLLFDLHKRRFLPRSHQSDACKEELFRQANLTEIDALLLTLKTRIAASLSRIRIGSQALELNALLPTHLKDDRVTCLEEAFVTGWINSFRAREEPRQMIEGAGLRPIRPNQESMEPFNYQFDPICPKFVLCHPAQRTDLLQSPFVRDNILVLQDRSFCVGPALLHQVLVEFDLGGKVVQTHISSPRSIAYLANIIVDIEKIEELLAFGAADKKEEYEDYLQTMGVTNVRVFSERFVDVSPESDLLEGVVAVLASPPNTYSAVTDPVDLACSRGGDIDMLRVLTDVGGSAGSEERLSAIMEEQRETLMHSMSKPQIQVVIYETHSILESENETMVCLTMEAMNRTARERHAEDQGAKPLQTQSSLQVAEEGADLAQKGSDEVAGASAVERSDTSLPSLAYSNIRVPSCDLFEVGTVPNICLSPNKIMQDEGCYLAILQRKEIVRLDAKYMINIAESRGLFGEQGVAAPSSKKTRAQKKRAAMAAARSSSRSGATLGKRHSRANRKIEVERIAAPTQASLMRQVHARTDHLSPVAGGVGVGVVVCKRHQHHTNECGGNMSKESSMTSTGTVLSGGNRSSGKRKNSFSGSDSATCSENHSRTPMHERSSRILTVEEQAELVKRLSTPTQASLSRNVGNRKVSYPLNGRKPMYDIMEVDSKYQLTSEPKCPMCRHRHKCAHLQAYDTAHPNTPTKAGTEESPSLDDFNLLYDEDKDFLLG